MSVPKANREGRQQDWISIATLQEQEQGTGVSTVADMIETSLSPCVTLKPWLSKQPLTPDVNPVITEWLRKRTINPRRSTPTPV